jgi:hypothetical protein
VRCALPVTRECENRYGTLHGGCIGTPAPTPRTPLHPLAAMRGCPDTRRRA